MEVDAELIGEHELHSPHEVLRAWLLADHDVGDLAVDHAFPIDGLRIDDRRVWGPVRHDLVPVFIEIFQTVFHHVLSDILPGEVRRHIPIGVESGVADVGGEHRRRPFRLTHDHDHRIHRLAVLVHVQALLGRVDEYVALPSGGQHPRALEIELQKLPLLFGRVIVAGERLPQLRVDWMHPAHRPDIFRKRGGDRRTQESSQRSWRRGLETGIDIGQSGPGIVAEVFDVGDECR